ncbi:MAG: ABC transporter substrate-binding protein [Burkholderiales bacterium]|nr:ABC transporter substrate-binding protein [Burkholderiales bacterium]MBK8664394.1 ABC transporter substrate-binding protein [Burkholderiales bacterium]
MKTRKLLFILAVCAAGHANLGMAQSNQPVKIGILNDQSGPYSSITGPGAVVAARLAVEDVGGTLLGRPVEVLVADHQHKPDIGASIARRWFDTDGVSAIFDIYNSGVALAVQKIAEDKNKLLISTVNSGELTGKSCSHNGMQWGPDSYALATLTVKGVDETKPSSWYFLTVDYTAGHSLEQYARQTVEKMGGKVMGAVRFPLGTTDFSSFLLQAQTSKANNVAIVGGGADVLNAAKQADEFQLQRTGQRLVTPSMTTAEAAALDSKMGAGLPIVFSFYWDQSPETRAWAERFRKIHGSLPTDIQANVYRKVCTNLQISCYARCSVFGTIERHEASRPWPEPECQAHAQAALSR